MGIEDIALTGAEYALLLSGHAWIRTVDPYASLSRGWVGIMADLLDVLDVLMERVAEDHPTAHATHFSTKAKFGGLRVSFGLAGVKGPPAPVWRLLRPPIEDAEERSARTCEVCGAPGRTWDVDEWLVTLCDAHAADGA